MENIVVRLLAIEIMNLKNVKNGKIDFLNSNIKKNLKLQLGDVLGIYGQNGSGKTAIIEALGVLKLILIGMPLEDELKNLITYGENDIKLIFKFYIEIKNKRYVIKYKVVIKESKDEGIRIQEEKIEYSVNENDEWSKNKILIGVPFNTTNSEKNFENFKDIFIKDSFLDILVNQEVSRKLKLSSIFSKEAKKNLKKDTDLFNIVAALEYYGKLNLFVVSNKDIGMITLNLLLPLKIKNIDSCGEFPIQIDKNENITVNEIIYPIVKNSIEQINTVLKRIIPDFQLKIEEQKKEFLANGSINIIAGVHSIIDGKEISLRYESEGIKRIISILGVLIAAYNQPSVCLAIDELDSGIFEYLLGEILEILSTEIKGQLIFTSHNLRILEKIDKNKVVFSTINPDNRYIKFEMKDDENLRDMYLRELVIQEQDEQLYKDISQSDIKRAFYKAGVNNERKR